jgi:hypothetical protein
MMKQTLLALAIAGSLGLSGIATAADMASPPNSLVVTDSGDVGIATDAPLADLHIVGEGTLSAVAPQAAGDEEELLRMESSIPPRLTLVNSTSGRSWSLAMTGGNALNILYLERRRVTFNKSGDMYLVGTLTQNSDRDSKTAITPVDSRQILETVANLPISTWEYKSSAGVKHLGPMAQDFHAAFGLGNTPKGISSIDTGGVALAAIKGLNANLKDAIQSKDEEIRSLQRENADLSERLTMLETLVNKLTAKEVVMIQ